MSVRLLTTYSFSGKIVIIFVISIAEMLPVSPLLALLPWSVAVKPAYSFISELSGSKAMADTPSVPGLHGDALFCCLDSECGQTF